ncbi:DUF3784 domain-containing protein [Halothermothrix orenii]|uniref:DUF3784 domain-containing protein n=1 Tax=Halothermothrix orenii (strain H 168 / OCM 544 / DSM 9562) TaxID=373903 RepID=B8CXU1_HALOH|nr:DUF3784 domain-containing protein [Halothermothrix orenii]ACL70110.1 hypothetical protein Hore_13600 [Halothermothrix orenii H 168]
MTIVLLIVGIFLSVLGLLIWKYNLVNLIAGYSEEKTRDKQGLAKWVGKNILIMGALTILISILEYLLNITMWIVVTFIIIVVVLSIRTNIGCKKYEK